MTCFSGLLKKCLKAATFKHVFLLSLILIISAFSVFSVAASEYEFDMSSEETYENSLVEDFVSSFPSDISEVFPKSLTETDTSGAFSIECFYKRLLSSASSAVSQLGGGFLPLVASLMVSAVAAGAYPMSDDGGMWKICSGTVSAAIVFTQRIAILDTAEQFLSIVSGVTTTCAPAVSALYAATGNITAATVASSGMLTAIAIVSQIFSEIICPAAKLSFFLSVIGAVSGSEFIYALSSLIRKISSWILTLVMAIVTFTLPIQTVLAHSADSAVASAARFAAGSLIPIVGGAVGDAITTVSASFNAVKNACGALGVAAMLVMLIPPFISLFISRVSFTLCSSMAEMLSCSTEKKLIDECGSVCSLILAVCLCAALMFIFSMTLMVRTGIVIGNT